jgi:hypothetical protein
LIKKHQATESELTHWNSKITDLLEYGKKMASSHFNAESIQKACREVNDSFQSLHEPARRRRNNMKSQPPHPKLLKV